MQDKLIMGKPAPEEHDLSLEKFSNFNKFIEQCFNTLWIYD